MEVGAEMKDFLSKVKRLAIVHIGDNDELGVLANDILKYLDETVEKKLYKQLEILEDALIIYNLKRG
jgi:hypothetical protein